MVTYKKFWLYLQNGQKIIYYRMKDNCRAHSRMAGFKTNQEIKYEWTNPACIRCIASSIYGDTTGVMILSNNKKKVMWGDKNYLTSFRALPVCD